jgi:hypothetical protein
MSIARQALGGWSGGRVVVGPTKSGRKILQLEWNYGRQPTRRMTGRHAPHLPAGAARQPQGQTQI